jgi:mannose-1-phosphate guanylyltransferase
VTIGIGPSRPETGFGYIEVDRTQSVSIGQREAYHAASFREKPNPVEAAHFLVSGNFLWNSGMFFWTLSAFSRALERADSKVAAIMMEIAQSIASHDLVSAALAFLAIPNLSIDYALMEKAENVYVVESDFAWDDLGAWDALERARPADSAGNILAGQVVALDSRNSILINESEGTVVCVLGLDEVVIVTTDDAILVCAKNRAQDVRKVVDELKARGSQAL